MPPNLLLGGSGSGHDGLPGVSARKTPASARVPSCKSTAQHDRPQSCLRAALQLQFSSCSLITPAATHLRLSLLLFTPNIRSLQPRAAPSAAHPPSPSTRGPAHHHESEPPRRRQCRPAPAIGPIQCSPTATGSGTGTAILLV